MEEKGIRLAKVNKAQVYKFFVGYFQGESCCLAPFLHFLLMNYYLFALDKMEEKKEKHLLFPGILLVDENLVKIRTQSNDSICYKNGNKVGKTT